MNLRHDGSSFPDRSGNALGRTCPHIADGENTGPTGLKWQDRAGICASPARRIGAGDHEPLVIHRDAAIEPGCVRIRANEQEKVAQWTGVEGSRRAFAKHCCCEAREFLGSGVVAVRNAKPYSRLVAVAEDASEGTPSAK